MRSTAPTPISWKNRPGSSRRWFGRMSGLHFTRHNFRWDAGEHRLQASFCLETLRARQQFATGNDDRCSSDTNVTDSTSLPLHLDRDIAPAIDRVPLLSSQYNSLARWQQSFPVEVDRGYRVSGARDRVLRDAIGGCEVTQVDEADWVFRLATDEREAPVASLLAVGHHSRSIRLQAKQIAESRHGNNQAGATSVRHQRQ